MTFNCASQESLRRSYHLNSNSSDMDDELYFSQEDEDAVDQDKTSAWKIIIADDDTNVHETTMLALNGIKILGKPLQFLHAYSAKEAQSLIQEHPDTALILLDVVMETMDAGLKLVDTLRTNEVYRDLKIVLRTGQPGYAKDSVLDNYAVDGYVAKSQMTRYMLVSMLNDTLDDKKHRQ